MRTKINVILSILLILILTFSTICSTYAVTQQELNDIREDMDEVQQQINANQAQKTQALKDIDDLDFQIDEAKQELSVIEANLRVLEKEIAELTEKLEEKIKEYDAKYEAACTRVVAQYKYGTVSYLDVLLNSKSPMELVSSCYLMGQVIELDEQFLTSLEQEKIEIENEKKEVEDKKAEVEIEKQKAEKQKVNLTNKQNEKKRLVSQLDAADAKLQNEMDAMRSLYDAKQDEWRRQALAAGSSGGSYAGGKLAFPCSYYTRVSSYFGSRGSPLTGGSSYHKGIDLASPKGTSILAAESGKVISVYSGCIHNYGKSKSCGCGSGFGNYLMITHGGGMVTVYAHCTSINVSVGQTVTRGQVIATVGSTGASTGYHLHFGTLLNGTYVNPAPYIGL